MSNIIENIEKSIKDSFTESNELLTGKPLSILNIFLNHLSTEIKDAHYQSIIEKNNTIPALTTDKNFLMKELLRLKKDISLFSNPSRLKIYLYINKEKIKKFYDDEILNGKNPNEIIIKLDKTSELIFIDRPVFSLIANLNIQILKTNNDFVIKSFYDFDEFSFFGKSDNFAINKNENIINQKIKIENEEYFYLLVDFAQYTVSKKIINPTLNNKKISIPINNNFFNCEVYKLINLQKKIKLQGGYDLSNKNDYVYNFRETVSNKFIDIEYLNEIKNRLDLEVILYSTLGKNGNFKININNNKLGTNFKPKFISGDIDINFTFFEHETKNGTDGLSLEELRKEVIYYKSMPGGEIKTEMNLINYFKSKGYKIVKNRKDLIKIIYTIFIPLKNDNIVLNTTKGDLEIKNNNMGLLPKGSSGNIIKPWKTNPLTLINPNLDGIKCIHPGISLIKQNDSNNPNYYYYTILGISDISDFYNTQMDFEYYLSKKYDNNLKHYFCPYIMKLKTNNVVSFEYYDIYHSDSYEIYIEKNKSNNSSISSISLGFSNINTIINPLLQIDKGVDDKTKKTLINFNFKLFISEETFISNVSKCNKHFKIDPNKSGKYFSLAYFENFIKNEIKKNKNNSKDVIFSEIMNMEFKLLTRFDDSQNTYSINKNNIYFILKSDTIENFIELEIVFETDYSVNNKGQLCIIKGLNDINKVYLRTFSIQGIFTDVSNMDPNDQTKIKPEIILNTFSDNISIIRNVSSYFNNVLNIKLNDTGEGLSNIYTLKNIPLIDKIYNHSSFSKIIYDQLNELMNHIEEAVITNNLLFNLNMIDNDKNNKLYYYDEENGVKKYLSNNRLSLKIYVSYKKENIDIEKLNVNEENKLIKQHIFDYITNFDNSKEFAIENLFIYVQEKMFSINFIRILNINGIKNINSIFIDYDNQDDYKLSLDDKIILNENGEYKQVMNIDIITDKINNN